MKDLYSVLEVSRTASPEVIRAAYRQLAKKYHPDNKETGSHEKLLQLKEAHDVLIDPAKRAVYDAMGHQNGNGRNGHAQQQPGPNGRPVWVNGIGWVIREDAGPYPSEYSGPTPYPQSFPQQYQTPLEEMMRQAAAELGHGFVDNFVETMMNSLRRGRR